MRRLLLTIIALAGVVQSSFSQADADSLTVRVAALEKQTASLKHKIDLMPTISGFIQLGYTWDDAQTSNFNVKRARVKLEGALARNLDYRLQLEFASPKIVDAYIRYRPFNQLNIKFGEFKVPFSIESTDYLPLNTEAIDAPTVVRKLVGYDDVCGVNATGRDIGLALYGGFLKRDAFSIINYDVAVMNGEGINLKDRNRSKDVVGRLTVQPLRALKISGSYYWGEYGPNYVKRTRYAVGLSYDNRLVVRSEFIGGTTDSLRSCGLYAIVGWHFGTVWTPFVRYDAFKEDTASAATLQNNYTVGVAWQPVKYLRCQLNYTFTDYRDRADRNTVGVLVTGIF